MTRTLMFVLFLFIASNVNAAVTNGDLYKACRDLADDNFELDKQTSVVCFSTFHAVQDIGQTICQAKQRIDEKIGQSEIAEILSDMLGVGAKDISIEATIQHYINNMKDTPETWEQDSGFFVAQSIMFFSPCE